MTKLPAATDIQQSGAIVLGEGRLSWPRAERIGDRYGAVTLMRDGDSLTKPTGYVPMDRAVHGTRGTLVAEVLATRESTHIGDLFRGLFPETPDVGDCIELGTGTAFIEESDFGADLVGLEPDDGRQTDWLNPSMLYRAHEQTVRLIFIPAGELS